MENETPQHESRLESIAAILIAVVTVIGAVVAWRASVAADSAGDADTAGLRASIDAEKTRALNFVDAYEHYGAYTAYARYNNLGNALADEAAHAADEQQAAALDRQSAEAFDLATANQSLFPNRYLNRDGSYNVKRELGESWADAAQQEDLNPEAHFVEADRLRKKTNQLVLAVTILALSLVSLTIAESAPDKFKLPLTALGALIMIAGVVAALYFEFKL